MRHLLALLCVAVGLTGQTRLPFKTTESAEVVAEIEMSSPGSDWAIRGREAAIAVLRVDGKTPHHVVVYGGPDSLKYRIALGKLAPGEHALTIERDPEQSAAASELKVSAAEFIQYPPSHSEYGVHANAPILFARSNTAGRFSDIPLLMYCERVGEGGQPVLQYTVIFSNEDGGTSTRALMARWGRTTDIEYIYKVFLKPDGAVARRTVQGPEHKELEYKGPFDDAHPLLMPVTDNNMVAGSTGSSQRYQLGTAFVDLTEKSRETVMDAHRYTYQVMAKELEREDKLRPFGVAAGQKISDLRNYLFIDYTASHQNSAFSVTITLKKGRAFSSDLGRLDYTIWRDGTVRTTVELPPGTGREHVDAIMFKCLVAPAEKGQPLAHSGACRLAKVNSVFFLDRSYLPAPSFFSFDKSSDMPTGQAVVFRP